MKKQFCQAILQEIEGEKLFVASDETVDRHGEVIKVDGWQLDNYKKNPIILAYHDNQVPPLGFSKKIGYKTIDGKKKLVYEPDFHGKTELSRFYKELKEEGYPLASSVGFIPQEMEDGVITKAELLEISIVNVGANANAISLGLKLGYDMAFLKSVMPEGFDEAKKEYDIIEAIAKIEAQQKEIDSLKKQIKTLSEVEHQIAVKKGREPVIIPKSKRIEELTALKVLRKAIDNLNHKMKEEK